ncbi:MAG TPA: 30S ribosomal protein S7 [Candidatus Wallbacteria bacterium]|nr:MAG: 30S ribosomal protein S7 [bacterium ADurb.Bin243]HOT75001.1 30S ribosomal protein S7 [Candidatus Wallbacteria bacterium]
MGRRKEALKRKTPGDPIYNDVVLEKFANNLMYEGKKNTSHNIVYGALEILKTKVKDKEPLEVFRQALQNAMPLLEVKSRRVGGATYQVPLEIKKDRSMALAFRWIINYSRSRSGRSMGENLANELLDAYNNQGSTIKKREDTHKMAEANKAFSHFKW